MAGAYIYNDPNLEAKRRFASMQHEQQINDSIQAQQKAQNVADERTRNQLTAERSALDQSYMMQKDANNPRTVTDTSMAISSPPPQSGKGTSGTKAPASGGFGNAAPQIDGRYMSLVQFQQPNLQNAPGATPQVQMPTADFTPQDATAFQNAAFARLKDKSGALGQSAIQSLAEQLAGRGVSGQSGTFGRGLADIVSQSVQPLADLNVEHLGQEYAASGRARELSEARALAGYQGGITQRGQDISQQQAMNNLLTQIAQIKYQDEIQQTEGALNRQLEALYRMI